MLVFHEFDIYRFFSSCDYGATIKHMLTTDVVDAGAFCCFGCAGSFAYFGVGYDMNRNFVLFAFDCHVTWYVIVLVDFFSCWYVIVVENLLSPAEGVRPDVRMAGCPSVRHKLVGAISQRLLQI